MAEEAPSALLAPAPPLTQRLAETPPWSPVRLALAIAASLFALLLLLELLLGRMPIVLGTDTGRWAVESATNFRILLVMILLVAYLPAAHAYGARGARGAIAELRPFLRCGPQTAAELLANAGRFEPGALRRAGWIGMALTSLIPFWIDRSLSAWAFWTLPIEPIFQRALLPVLGWLAARFLYSAWAESRRLSRIGRDFVHVDLLDLRCFEPLTRQGLRYALLTVGIISILALYLFDYDKRGLFAVVIAANGVALAAAFVALLLPLRGARQAIVAAKRAELDWCDAALREARAALDAGAPPDRRPITELVAWRTLVDSVHEWPLDAPTLRRFGLYLAIPLGSWLGGAFVDHVVDVLLR